MMRRILALVFSVCVGLFGVSAHAASAQHHHHHQMKKVMAVCGVAVKGTPQLFGRSLSCQKRFRIAVRHQNGAGVFFWRKIGGSPVVNSGEWHRGDRDGKLTLTEKQRRQIAKMGLDPKQVDNDLRGGRCHAVTRPIGYKWRNMGSRKGLMGRPVRNATGGDIDVWECPTIDVAMGCGNPLPRYENPPAPPAPPAMVERVLSCERIATLSLQGGASQRAWALDMWNKAGCLLDVAKGVQLGPVVGVVAGRYGDKTNGWLGNGVSAFVGVESRVKPFLGMQALEAMVGVGPGCTGGGNKDVKVPWTCGAVAELSVQLRDEFKVAESTTLQWRLMLGARLPIGQNDSDVLWRGQVVGREFSRNPVAWAEGRIALRNPNWWANPRLTLGGFRTWGVESPWGVKALIGLENQAETFAVDAGIQCIFGAGCMPIARVIWDPILSRWIVAREKVAVALTDGAKSSAASIGVRAQPSGRGLAAAYAKQHARAVAKANVKADARWTKTHNDAVYGGFNPEPDRSGVPDNKPSTPVQLAATAKANSGPFQEAMAM